MGELTIKDIANICGVGVSTVSRAINNHPDVNSRTKAQILKIIEEYNYIPNNSARNLRRTNSNTIAVLVKGITNPFFAPFIKILGHEIEQQKYSMLIHQVDENADEIYTASELIKEKNLQGIIFLGGRFNHSTEKLKQLSVPFVMCTTTAEAADLNSYSSVSVNDMDESYKAADYLCRLGHKNIAFILPEGDKSIGRNRLEGYKKALKAHHLPFNENLISYFPTGSGEYSLKNGYSCMQELLNRKEFFTAIFAISDILAIGACKAIIDAGKSIPKDYSVIGFDNIELSSYLNPPLTTISQPVNEIALKSVTILFELIASEGSCTQQHIIFPGELIERGSCKSIE